MLCSSMAFSRCLGSVFTGRWLQPGGKSGRLLALQKKLVTTLVRTKKNYILVDDTGMEEGVNYQKSFWKDGLRSSWSSLEYIVSEGLFR